MRKINYKNLGWLVSTVLYWCFVAPFLAWYIITTLKTGTAPDATGLFITGMIVIWYNYRNKSIGYGLTYWRHWNYQYEDRIWKMNIRAKRERARIEHHRKDSHVYDVIAK